jgi:hypothetical protein
MKKYKIQLTSWDRVCLGLKRNGRQTLHFGRTIICSFFAYIFACFRYFFFFWLDFTHRWHEEQQKNWNENFNFRLSSALFGFALKTITFDKLKDIHSYIYTIIRHHSFFQGTLKIFGVSAAFRTRSKKTRYLLQENWIINWCFMANVISRIWLKQKEIKVYTLKDIFTQYNKVV